MSDPPLFGFGAIQFQCDLRLKMLADDPMTDFRYRSSWFYSAPAYSREKQAAFLPEREFRMQGPNGIGELAKCHASLD
jgi:hypothetical protein